MYMLASRDFVIALRGRTALARITSKTHICRRKKKKKKAVNNRDGGVLEQPRHKCLIEPVPALTGWLFHRLASQILRLLAVDLILT